MSEDEFRGVQDGQVVFGVTAPTGKAYPEAIRYAMTYATDGPVQLQQKVGGRWKDTICLTFPERHTQNTRGTKPKA